MSWNAGSKGCQKDPGILISMTCIPAASILRLFTEWIFTKWPAATGAEALVTALTVLWMFLLLLTVNTLVTITAIGAGSVTAYDGNTSPITTRYTASSLREENQAHSSRSRSAEAAKALEASDASEKKTQWVIYSTMKQ